MRPMPANLYVICPHCRSYRLTRLALLTYFDEHLGAFLSSEGREKLASYVVKEYSKHPGRPVELSKQVICSIV